MFCTACGRKVDRYIFQKLENKKLINGWRLSSRQKKQIALRESMFCPFCHNSTRARVLAAAIVKTLPFKKVKSLAGWVEKAAEQKLKVIEINYCGNLHSILTKLPDLKLSQYHESTCRAKIFNWLKVIKKEDITSLNHQDKSFDLVLHSDVLEHVENTDGAIRECRRILKPSGVCLFTIPVILSRKTIKRAAIDKKTGKIKYLKDPYYHGSGPPDNLVFWEFGGDFIKDHKLECVYSVPGSNTYVYKLTR